MIGIEQMKKLDWRVKRKKEMFALYRELLKDVEEITFLPTTDEVPPWFIDILVPDPAGLREYLKQHEIGSRPFYPVIHSQPAYNWPGSHPNAEYAAQRGVWLPSSSFISNEQIAMICNAIQAFFQGG